MELMEEVSTYCIMCLGTEMKMFQMTGEMINTYYELLSIEINTDFKKMYGCFECTYLLNKNQEFKTKCCKAYNILSSLNLGSFEVTKENLRSIDRKQNKLESVLTQCIIDFFDSDNPFEISNPIGKVTNDIALIDSVTYSIENYNSQEVLQSPVIDLITFDNNSRSQSKLRNEEVKNTSTKVGMKDDEYLLDVSETVDFFDEINKDNNTDSSVESTKEKSKLEMSQISNDLDSTVSQINFEIEGADKVSDNDCIILDISPFKVAAQFSDGNISKSKQRTALKETDNIKFDLFKDQVTIIQLTKADAKKELLLRKESINYKMSPHKCDLCYRGFNSKTTYQAHMKKHSLEYGTLKCDVCKQNFLGKRYLRRHCEICHTRKFICKLCPYICYRATQAKCHLQAHKGKTYTCETCEKAFRLPSSLANHVRIRHKGKDICDLCGSVFMSPKGLHFHKGLSHKTETNERLGPQCAECDVHFASELAWKRHRVLCSRHQVQFGCKVCGDIFQNSEILKVHMLDMHPSSVHWSYETKKNCKLYKKPQANNSEYRGHLKNEHSTKINTCICEVCGMEYLWPCLLAEHKKKHSDVKAYSCSVCGMRTKYKGVLKQHQRIHSDEYKDKYLCDLCGGAFSDKSRLVRHIKGHMGIRPFKCRKEACDKKFRNKCDEKTHYLHVHCKLPYPKRDRSRSGNKRNARKKLQVFQI